MRARLNLALAIIFIWLTRAPGFADKRVAFDRIREDVLRATANAQEPSLSGSLAGEFYLIDPK